MEGIIINFRGSHKTKYSNQMIVKVSGIEKKDDAFKLIGKKVIWATPSGKEINGKVTKDHGNKGAVRVRFEKGLPGQSLGEKVNVE